MEIPEINNMKSEIKKKQQQQKHWMGLTTDWLWQNKVKWTLR